MNEMTLTLEEEKTLKIVNEVNNAKSKMVFEY